MKRIGIFAFYDKKGIADEYKLYLLKSLIPFLTDLIIVINGSIEDSELNKLREYTDDIFVRENRGYDGGAYKDVLTNKYREIEWLSYDEIILFNDTFYGPLFSWEAVFSVMSGAGSDFWGLSRNCGGTTAEGAIVTNHVQSFFLVVNKSMFQAPQWNEFWQQLEYSVSYASAVQCFEIRFTKYFADKGFRFSTWLDINDGAQYIEREGDNPYIKYAYDIIAKCHFPIVKYRAMSPVNCTNACAVLDYIEKNTDYDKGLILQHLTRLEQEGQLRPFGISELERFVSEHSKVYIFGHGQYGRGLAEYFRMKDWEFCGFVVSAPGSDEEIGVEDVALGERDGLIVALWEKGLKEVRGLLEGKFNADQLLFPRC